MGGLASTVLDPLSESAGALWRTVEARAQASYFLSPPFVELWLSALPAPLRPMLHVLMRGAEPVALFFLGSRRVVRHRILPSRACYLNTTGDARFDEITLEHNQVLAVPDARLSLGEWLDLLPGQWDELFLPALASDVFPGCALAEPITAGRVLIERQVDAPYVDLARVRSARGGYLSLLGANTRSQVRRAERGYGETTLEIAGSREQALDILAELVELHGRHWRERGQPGAFSDPWFLGFHRRLVSERHPHGEVQLMRLRNARATIGCLYNFVWRGRVLFYQSGLGSSEDPRLKPGYVCHARAVEHNAALGHGLYDFLGGDSRYKHNLATGNGRLVWARVQKPLVRFSLEHRLREIRSALRPQHTG